MDRSIFGQRWERIAFLALFFLCLLLGGGGVHGPIFLGLLQILALPLFAWAAYRAFPRSEPHASPTFPASGVFPVAMVAAWLLLAVVQLVPLPASLWSALPGRHLLSNAVDLTGQAGRSFPLSLYPDRTYDTVLTWLPATALFLGLCFWSDRWRRIATYILVGVATASALLGVLQYVSADAGALGLYPVQMDKPSGLFANRNHQAAFLVIGIVFVAALAGQVRLTGRPGLDTGLMWLLALFLAAAALVTESRGGLLLLVPALLGAFALFIFPGRDRDTELSPKAARWKRIGGLTAAVLALLILATIGWRELAPRLAQANDLRIIILPDLWWAIKLYFPFGSGLGTFDPVFRSAEQLAIVSTKFVNHAHNDYLEIALEAGIPGLLLILVFLGWYLMRARTILRHRAVSAGDRLQRAAVIVIGLLLLHSVVDYPLRTQALGAVFAFCLAMLCREPGHSGRAHPTRLRVGGAD